MPKAAQTVEVRVLEGAVFYHGGRAFYPGHALSVSASEAQSLVVQEVAEIVKPRQRRRSARR